MCAVRCRIGLTLFDEFTHAVLGACPQRGEMRPDRAAEKGVVR
jgi:hypothetical protein